MSANKRLLVATILCMLVMMLYTYVILPKLYPPKPQKPQSPQPTQQERKVEEKAQEKKEEPKEAKQESALPKVELIEKIFETKRFTLKFSNKGGSLAYVWLKDYKDESGKQNYQLLIEPSDMPGALSLNVAGSKVYLSDVNWETESADSGITFKLSLGGLEIKKVFTVHPDDYDFDFKMVITNKGDREENLKLELLAFPGINYDSDYRVSSYQYAFAGIKSGDWSISKISLPDPKKTSQNQTIGTIKQSGMLWSGVKNRHFACVLIPQDGAFIDSYEFNFIQPNETVGQVGHIVSKQGRGYIPTEQLAGNISCTLKTVDLVIKPNVDSIFNFRIFAGPMIYSELEKQGNGIQNLLHYTGFFDFIGFTILGILNFFYGVAGNYGMAIILTTFLIRLVLFPLDKKSQVSMFKMQKLQPKITALKEKYKNDKQKLGVEQMKLFKEYGVNPLSGCLPVLLSLPIYIGMYSVFDISVELRRAPFLFWIKDLSLPDRLTKLPFSFFGYDDLNVLPIVMTITWLIQSLIMPKSPDPEQRMQQNMMMFMPLLFGFLCYGLASGLSLYFFVNSLLGIIEQRLIKKFYLKA